MNANSPNKKSVKWLTGFGVQLVRRDPHVGGGRLPEVLPVIVKGEDGAARTSGAESNFICALKKKKKKKLILS